MPGLLLSGRLRLARSGHEIAMWWEGNRKEIALKWEANSHADLYKVSVTPLKGLCKLRDSIKD
jgi:hypothetical protein